MNKTFALLGLAVLISACASNPAPMMMKPVDNAVLPEPLATPAAVAGYPHLTVPCGLVRGLPLGLSFVGRPWSEARLLAFGQAYEQASQARRAPRLARRTTPS